VTGFAALYTLGVCYFQRVLLGLGKPRFAHKACKGQSTIAEDSINTVTLKATASRTKEAVYRKSHSVLDVARTQYKLLVLSRSFESVTLVLGSHFEPVKHSQHSRMSDMLDCSDSKDMHIVCNYSRKVRHIYHTYAMFQHQQHTLRQKQQYD
jgi:hypothetical protein